MAVIKSRKNSRLSKRSMKNVKSKKANKKSMRGGNINNVVSTLNSRRGTVVLRKGNMSQAGQEAMEAVMARAVEGLSEDNKKTLAKKLNITKAMKQEAQAAAEAQAAKAQQEMAQSLQKQGSPEVPIRRATMSSLPRPNKQGSNAAPKKVKVT